MTYEDDLEAVPLQPDGFEDGHLLLIGAGVILLGVLVFFVGVWVAG